MSTDSDSDSGDSVPWLRVDTDGKPGLCWFKPDSERLDLGDGLWMYSKTEVRLKATNAAVTIGVGVEAGRLVAKKVTVEAGEEGPVRTETLRAIQLANLVSHAADGIQMGKWGAAKPTPEEAAYVARHGLDDTTLGIVARVYRLAYLRGAAPTKTVEMVFQLPRSTAGRWVAAARAGGHLKDSQRPGKAGV